MATSTKPSIAVTAKTVAKLSVMTLAIMNITAVVSLRGLPSEAEYGLSSIFYYLFAAIFFLIPVSLVAAELATGWPQKGGVFRWVGEAFGPRWGFVAIWLQWLQNTIWYPTVLTYAAVALAFIGLNQSFDQALSANKFFVLPVVLVVYWAATWVALRGLSSLGKLSKWGGMIGTIIPAAILIVMGFAWFFSGRPIQMNMDPSTLIPNLTNPGNLVLAVGIFLFYAGMEMNAVHIKDIDNPQTSYPKAILMASIATVVIFVLGTLAIGFVVPAKQINLTQSLLIAYDDFLNAFGLGFLSPVIAIMLAFGVFGGVVTWVGGPSKGLLAVGRSGFLPPFLQKTNQHGIQINILLVQGAIVTLLSIMFVILPSVQAAYQILSQLTVTLYLIMYILMFAAAIRLRYTQPNTPRTYRVPGGMAGMWIIGGAGFVGSLLAFVLGFLPPSQIQVGGNTFYVGALIVGNLIFVALPILIYALRKPGWKQADAAEAVEPFTWETQTASPKK